MSLQDLEVLLKKYWEGMFKKGAGPVQPVEMARSLVREMSDKRRVSVSRVYAPNVFAVCLGADDFEQTEPLQAALARELEEHILMMAEEKGFTLIGKPQVTFEKNESIAAGEIMIRSSFAAAAESAARFTAGDDAGAGCTGELQRIEHTMIFDKREAEGREPGGIYLAVVHGPDMGKIFSLGAGQKSFTIGRKLTNAISLTDINASREHARIEWQDGALHLIDLKSRNGTFVNGDRIEAQGVAGRGRDPDRGEHIGYRGRLTCCRRSGIQTAASAHGKGLRFKGGRAWTPPQFGQAGASP